MTAGKAAKPGFFGLLVNTLREDIRSLHVDVARAVEKKFAPEPPADPVEPVVHKEPFEAATRIMEASIDGVHLTMRLYLGANARIERIIRVPTERHAYMRAAMAFRRVAIAPYTPTMARNEGRPFTLLSCLEFTRSMGLKKVKLHELATGKDAEMAELLRADEARIKQLRMAPAAATPATAAVAPAAPEKAEGEVIGEATGVVLSAADKRIQPRKDSKNAYWAFEVQVIDERGEKHEFIGKDLKEKFQQRVFTVGDRVHVVKRRASYDIGDEKATASRNKNFYSIRVLERAAA